MVARRRPLLRAAVVGGGAYLAGKGAAQRSAARQQQEADSDARVSDPEQSGQQGAAAPVPEPRAAQEPAGAGAGPSVTSQLDELVKMHERGALTDAEFSAAKARLLG